MTIFWPSVVFGLTFPAVDRRVPYPVSRVLPSTRVASVVLEWAAPVAILRIAAII